MKWIKSLATVAFVMGMAAGAQAGTAGLTGTGAFSGTFTMYDPTGAVVGGSAVVTGTMVPGAVTNNLTSPTPFFGFLWSAHDATLVDNGDGTYTSQAPFDWGATTSIPVVVVADITDNGNGIDSTFTTLDSDADGIPGTKMTAGPFTGFSPCFAGTVNLTAVPEPMSMALVGSSLLGLVGLRRKFMA